MPTAPSLAVGDSVNGDRLIVESLGQSWVLASSRRVTWQRTAQGIDASADSALTYVFSPVPDDGPPDWADRVVAATHSPITNTSSTLTRGSGEVTQRLGWKGATATSVIAVLPHQRALLGSDVKTVAGHYETARGQLTLVQASDLTLTYPLPGLLPGIPQIPLSIPNRAALQADLTSDLAAPNSEDAGSYYGPKALGRLATMLQIAERIGDASAASAILAKLRPRLVDWFTYTGPQDKHWLAFDSTWGGIVAHPSEFGNSDYYNDHHFHYGYLIAAAAAVAEVDPQFADQLRLGRRPARRRRRRCRHRQHGCGILPALPGVLGLRRALDRVGVCDGRGRRQPGVLERGCERLGCDRPVGDGDQPAEARRCRR